MNAKSIAPALLSALFLLPSANADAQTAGPSANYSRGDFDHDTGVESLSARMLAPVTHVREPRRLRKKGECERKMKTVTLDGIIYVAILDCNDRPL